MSSTASLVSTAPTRLHPALAEFLTRFCSQPEVLAPLVENQPRRHVELRDGDYLCRKGAQADDMWIILHGQVRIEDGEAFAFRHAGELVGELAFYRVGRPQEIRRLAPT